MTDARPANNLLNYDRKQMRELFVSLGEPAFRGDQVLKWIHQQGVDCFDDMTNLSKAFRTKLTKQFTITGPEVVVDKASHDGTRKFLLKLDCGNCIETVFIPEGNRGTLCVSSQVGCSLNCTFCSTAQQGFNRNLSIAEIIGQVWVAAKALGNTNQIKNERPITNVVMMGMGEPLLNFDNVVSAMNIMTDDFGYNISKYRLTLSTSGVVPALRELAKVSNVALAISLHAPTDELRTQLVPINKKYPISELMDACNEYFKDEPRRSITMEYVMLKGVNDQPEHARQLIKLLRNMRAKVNLIPFNPFPNTQYERSSNNAIHRFRDILIDGGLHTITRKTRGDDIDAACGQLAGEFQDRTKRSERLKKVPIVIEGDNAA